MCQSPFHPDCQGCTCHHVRPPCDHCVEHPSRSDLNTVTAHNDLIPGEIMSIRTCHGDGSVSTSSLECIDATEVVELGIPFTKVTLLANHPDLCLVSPTILADLRMQRENNRRRMATPQQGKRTPSPRDTFVKMYLDDLQSIEDEMIADQIMRQHKPISNYYISPRKEDKVHFSNPQNPLSWWADEMMPRIADLPPGNYDVAPGGITRIKPSTPISMKEFLDSLTDIELSIRRHVHDPDYREPTNDISAASPPPPPPAHAAIAPTLHRAALSLTPSPSLRADLRAGAPYLPDDDTPPHPRYRRR